MEPAKEQHFPCSSTSVKTETKQNFQSLQSRKTLHANKELPANKYISTITEARII